MTYVDLELCQCIRPSCRLCFEVCGSCGEVTAEESVPMVCPHCWRSRRPRPVEVRLLPPGELKNPYGLGLMEEWK